MGAVQEARGIS